MRRQVSAVLEVGASLAILATWGGVVHALADDASAAKTLTWSGASGMTWDGAALNWLDSLGATSLFSEGSDVLFGAVGAGEVQVSEGGVTPGAVTISGGAYTFTGGPIKGSGQITVENGAAVGMGARLDQQPLVIRSGTFKPTASANDLLGSPDVPIRVEEGGTFDLNVRSDGAAESLMTHNKKFKIAGAGASGEGALVNNGPVTGNSAGRVHTIELIGDAKVGGTGRWDVAQDNGGVNTGRPQVTGDHTLTVGGNQVVFREADINLKRIAVTDGATLGLENYTLETLTEGLHLQQGSVQFWYHHNPFTQAIFAEGPDVCLRAGRGNMKVTGAVHVAEGTTLKLSSWDDAVLRLQGGVFGAGALKMDWGIAYFSNVVEPKSLEIPVNNYAIYSDMAEESGEGKCLKDITVNGGVFGFAPSADKVYSGYTISGNGSFVPSFQYETGDNTAVPVTTVENTTITSADVDIIMGLRLSSFGNTTRVGEAILGEGFRAESLKSIGLGHTSSSPADATLTLGTGSYIKMKPDAEIILGQWNGEANNLFRLILDGGELDATAAKKPYVGCDGRNAEFLVKAGTAKLPGVFTRFASNSNARPLENVPWSDPNPGVGYEVFGMSGGTVELGGDFETTRMYARLPQIWLGGGTLVSTADWKTDAYQAATFETWGDPRDEMKKELVLDTNGHTVNFRSALQGNANVTITGGGKFIADNGTQGGVSGHWTIENSGENNLRNAAAFADGLTLKDGTAATIDIGARTNYVSLAVACNGDWFPPPDNNEFTRETFWKAAGVFPSLFTRGFQKLLPPAGEGAKQVCTAIRQEAEFYVDEAGDSTFAVQYDDFGHIVIDGTLVASSEGESSWARVGVGTMNLDSGWHRLNVTCQDGGGGSGPLVEDWKERKMAAGWCKGATTSTAAADYQPIDSTTLKMRPVSTVRWNRRYTKFAEVTDDWGSNDTYTFSMVTNSMQAIHISHEDTDGRAAWAWIKGSLNSYTGWTYVEADEAGDWTFEGLFDDRIGVQIDGKPVLATPYWSSRETVTVSVSAGWHKFKVTVADGSGGWGRHKDETASLYVTRPNAAKVPFDERNIRMSAAPYGFIGGELNVGEGATLTNTSETPCEIAGTVNGTGTLAGKYALTGTWNVTMDDGVNLKAVKWAGDGVDLSKGRVHVTLTGSRPIRERYRLGSAVTGASGVEVTSTLNGKPWKNGFRLSVEEGEAYLVNTRPVGLLMILR